ncbi:MAG: hypothetical protein SFY66_27805 [Oculatellaceae cyanobacterium bins.114]|nr:hypothetical protein [Oculatellaceae cyanobacterium bins.114]
MFNGLAFFNFILRFIPGNWFMEKPFRITFPTGAIATAVQVQTPATLWQALKELGLPKRQRVLVIIGGASKLSDEDFNRVQLLFLEVLAPLATQWGACVVDGGTDAGVMRLMGQARSTLNASFPLIGVTPVGLAVLPGQSATSPDAASLESNHTHFLLIPGSNWGDESPWIADVASVLADDQPSVAVLINGGEVSWKDASQNVQEGRSVITMAGSGRTADVLAAVLRGQATDQRAQEIIQSGLVKAIDLTAGREELTKTIEMIFAGKE